VTPVKPRATRWLQPLETFGLCLLYVTAFWGQAARWLPAPLDEWHSLLYRAIGPWWHDHVATGFEHREQTALYQLVESVFVAVLIPLWILHRNESSMRHAGLRWPDRSALRLTIAGVFLSLPFGLHLSRVVPDPWSTPVEETLRLLGVIPEHLLIFGIFGALLLGGRLRGSTGPHPRTQEAFAVVATATIFALVHVGEPRAVVMASLPLGMINAFVTIRTASIWPAIGAHWIMNIVPMTADALRA
jgi:membrane protease YdiL (CAAX protease family)